MGEDTWYWFVNGWEADVGRNLGGSESVMQNPAGAGRDIGKVKADPALSM